MLFPSSRNSGPCDRGSGDALTALEFSSVTRLLYRERQDREGQGRRDLESERKSERKRKKKAAAGKKPAAAPIRQTSLRSSEAQGSGLRTQELRTQELRISSTSSASASVTTGMPEISAASRLRQARSPRSKCSRVTLREPAMSCFKPCAARVM